MSAPRPCSGVVGACNGLSETEGGWEGKVWWRIVDGWKGVGENKREKKKRRTGGGVGGRRREEEVCCL